MARRTHLKVVKNLEEFYIHNDKDMDNILNKFFQNVLKYHNLEDIKFEVYERLLKKKYIENYRPLEIRIDENSRSWYVKPNHAKFSTYICKFIFNYIYAYYNKIKPDNLCLSLDEYNDSNYSENTNSKLKVPEEDYNPLDEVNLVLEMEQVLKNLEKKTKNKGTFVLENELELSIAKCLDNHGDKGCSEKELLSSLFNREMERKDLTGMEGLILKEIKEIEEKGIIKIVKDTEGNINYYLNNPERRSLYNLLRYYLKGYKDKEISEKFKVTVAGIGAMKRSLRKEISHVRDILRNVDD